MSKTSGPAVKPEKAPTRYPVLKKGRIIDCLGCKNGQTYSGPCGACRGTGKIKVK